MHFGLQLGPWHPQGSCLHCHILLDCSLPCAFWSTNVSLAVGFQSRTCFDILRSGILMTCPYQIQRFMYSFSTLCCPDLRLSSSSLTTSCHVNFIIVLRHPITNHITPTSTSLSPFHYSHPYSSTERTMLLKSFSFVRKNIPSWFQTFSRFLNAAPVLPNMLPT